MRVIFFALTTLFVLNALAQNVANIELDGSYQDLYVGESYNFRVTIVPWIEGKELVKEDVLEDKLTDALFVTKVSKVGRSENNHDALVMRFKAVLVEKIPSKITIQVKEESFRLNSKIKNKQIEDVKVENPIILESDKSLLKNVYLYTGLGLLVFGLICFVFFRLRQKNPKLKNELRQFAELKGQLKLEFLYVNKKFFLALYPELENVIKIINQEQYKRGWGSRDHSDLIAEIENIMRSER